MQKRIPRQICEEYIYVYRLRTKTDIVIRSNGARKKDV